jgi:hypothetical protein
VSASPVLIATQPAARTTSAVYDGEIWAQFDRPLDVRTITPLTVFLKLDGQRLAIKVTYDGITRRIFVHPTPVLDLQRTYTVEFSTTIHALDGTPLPDNVFFQFTTNSLRRVVYDYPVSNALEGPVSCFGWGGTKGPDGNLFFDVYASNDSLAVARRAVPVLQHSVFTRYLAGTAWPLGSRVYWAISSENATTHERMDGDVQSFRVLDGSAPLDSVVISPTDFGSNTNSSATQQACNSATTMPSGPSFNAGFHWNMAALGTNARVASVTFQLFFPSPNTGWNITQPSVWLAQNDWVACTMRAPGPPFQENSGLLANSVQASDVRSDLSSDRLASFFEAQYRQRTLLVGTLVRTLSNTAFVTPNNIDPTQRPRLVVRFYRLP